MEIVVGMSGIAETKVELGNTACSYKSGVVEVFATPSMIALMESAACECLAKCMGPGQTTVGASVNVSHVAASPIGSTVTAKATVKSVDGRKLMFDVEAWDEFGTIGSGTHGRAIIDIERFMAKAASRVGLLDTESGTTVKS
ncbi:MAG: thioesterase family protein [Clostridiales bacterium]|jgi:predicted thioesterase|nr:thioesterase family protein [Clostridiales bacterium]